MGNLPSGPYFGFNPGTLTAAPCAASAKIKFFRPSGSALLFLAERGPFDVGSLQQTGPIDPAAPVQAGDTVRDANGVVHRTTTKAYEGNFLTQSEGGAFAGIGLGPSGTLTFDVTAGGAIVYGATADNRTQDPSIQIARRFP